MRKIKFRAWHIEEHKMYSVYELDIFRSWIYGARRGKSRGDWWSNWKLMQFTGLRDKNGKEIYDGDILNHPDRFSEDTLVIEWVYDRWSIVEYYKGEVNHMADYKFYDCEIIGNIHENPELLKEAK